ncbi:M15 family metallopeptidase [Actinoplanes philippinensis]|uniref:M15 family metallopeptidase n=1 Tax=Actinoplanes philippinensis TaxID=35752 RepID=UPI0033CE09D9
MSRLTFESVPVRDDGDPLVDLAGYPFALEPVYHRDGLAPTGDMFLRQGVADRLAELQRRWQGRYIFKIFDAYRPRSVQHAIYAGYEERLRREHPEWDEDRLGDETQRFVTRAADPSRIPPHATGGAVDLTLVDESGRELDMGTGFDHFGPEAAPGHFEAADRDPVVREHRRLLLHTMLDAGFTVDDAEWWHFDLGNQSWAMRSGGSAARYGEVTEVRPHSRRGAVASARTV